MAWLIEWDERALHDLEKLDRQVQNRVITFLRDRIATEENPRRTGKSLAGTFKGLWRYRVGDYRTICRIEDEQLTVFIISVNHRREVYR